MERTGPPGALIVPRGNVPGASAAFLDKKAKSEIEDQLQQLQAECAAKDEEIARLKELTSQGKLQKNLQKALEENRDLRKEIERLYGEQISAQEISARLKAQEVLTESVQKEFAEYREQTKLGIEQMRQDREEADKQLVVFQQRSESVQQSEKEAVNLNEELLNKVSTYESQLQAQAALIAKLKDGSRLEELETATATLSDHLSQKELERQELERALLNAKSENAQLLQRTEDFEEKVKSTLADTVATLSEQLNHYKSLVEIRNNELLSERARYALLEDRSVNTDRKVLEMSEQIRLYENGYCLDDALKEQRCLNEELTQLKSEITSMVEKLNTRERQLERLLEENRVLRLKAGVDIDWGISEAEVQLEHQVEIEKLSSLINHYKDRIDRLENERIELLEELRQKAIQRGESGVVFFGLSTEKMELVEKYVESLRNGQEFTLSDESSSKVKLERDVALRSLEDIKTKYEQAVSQCNDLRRALASANTEVNDKKIDQIMELISRLQPENQSDNAMIDETNSESKFMTDMSSDHQLSAAHFVACLQELAKTEELLQMSRTTIAAYETSISSLSDRVNSLFLLHAEASENFKLEKDQLEQMIEKLSSQLSVMTQAAESNHEDKSASAGTSDSHQMTLEASRRRIAVLQSNEILLTRRLNVLEHALLTLESRETRYRDERIKLERVLKARIVQLEHSLANSVARAHTLENKLCDSIHRELYENLHTELKSAQTKFSELVADHANLQQQCQKINDMQAALDHHAEQASIANSKAETLAAQVQVLQQKLDEMPCEDDHKVELLAKVAALEIREGNAQRALNRAQTQLSENASRYATLSADLSALEDKHQALLLSYHTEKEAAAQLQKALSTQNAEHATAISVLQSQLSKAKSNAVRFKKLFQIAKKQAVYLSDSKHEVEEQLAGLKQAIIQLQTNSDEHVALGQLHHELIDARLEIRNLKRNLEESTEHAQALESEVLQQSKLLDESAAASFAENLALRSRIDSLQQCLANVAIADSWGLTNDQALALHKTNKLLAKRLDDARSEIVKARDRCRQAEDLSAQYQIDQAQNKETYNFVRELQSSEIEEKFQLQILEWTKQLKQLKLTKMQLEHQVASLSRRNSFNENLVSECQGEVQRLQLIVSEKDSKLIAQTVQFKQQASELAQFSKRKPYKTDANTERSDVPQELEEHHEREMAQLRHEMKLLQIALESKEDVIELQRQQLNKLESRLKADAEASAATNDTDPDLSKGKLLKAAEITIQNLRVLLFQKDAALTKYRDMLERTFTKYQSEKELDTLVIEQLKDEIANEKAEHSSMLHNALDKIEGAKQVPMSLISLKQHEDALAQKQKTIEELSIELQTVQSILEKSRKRSSELEAEQESMKDRLLKYEDELSSWHETEQMLSHLRQELLEKTRKQTHLEEVILQLKQQMVLLRQEQPPVKPTASPAANEETKKTISSLKATLKKFESQKSKLEDDHRTLEEQHRTTLVDLQLAKKALESSHVEISTLHNQLNAARSKIKLQREKYIAVSERLKSLTTELEESQDAKSKLIELQQKVSDQDKLIGTLHNKESKRQRRNLNEAVKTSRACSPVCWPENDVVSPRSSQKDAFEQWEQKKKLEKKVDTLKVKLQNKTSEMMKLEACIADLKLKLQRLENDNQRLIAALRAAEHNPKSGKNINSAIPDDHLESIEELRSQLFHSQDEVINLQRRLEVEAAGRIAQLELELKNAQALIKDKPRSAPEKSKLKQELDDLTQKNLVTSCENLDLRFDKEHSNIIIQRLRKRIAQLEQLTARGFKATSNVKESNTESELTATIDSMAKIIDSLKQENETLRLNSHSHLKYTEVVRSLKKAKKDWTAEVESLKAQLHAKAEEIASLARSESAAKQSYRSLRKELAKVKKELTSKESEANLLAQSVLELESQIEELGQTIEAMQANDQQPAPHALIQSNPDRTERWEELHSKYAALVAENEALKTELSAFDESFFDEIEDLKFQYSETSKRLALYRSEFGELPVH